jgi:hypothetical protein
MINQALHKTPIALDRERHRKIKLDRDALNDWSRLATMNSFFVNAVEFADTCREYPIVFVRAGDNPDTGKPEIAPVAVFGLTKEENLFVEGSQWRADYIPAQLRAWPFALVPTSAEQYALFIDQTCPAINETNGMALFEADGSPSAYLGDVQKYLETLETELLRTRAFCARLVELELMQDMRFEAKLADGNALSVDGFLALDEKKFAELPDNVVVELHKNGVLALIHAHHVSLGNMRRLFERRAKKTANA